MNNNHINTSCWLLITDYEILWCVYSLETSVVPTRRCSSVLSCLLFFLSFLCRYSTLYFNSTSSLKSYFFLFSYSNMIFSTMNFNHLYPLIPISPIFHISFSYILHFTFFTHCLYYGITPCLTTTYSISSNLMVATRLTYTNSHQLYNFLNNV